MNRALRTAKQQRLKLHKVPFIAYLEPEQKRELVLLSRRTGVPQSRYVRDGINLILRQAQEGSLAVSAHSIQLGSPPT